MGHPSPSRAVELVPPTLPVVTGLARMESARAWLSELPSLIEQVREAFDLRLSAPLHGGSCSWVAPAQLPDGTQAILKIGWPHREMYGEPIALRLWAGRGAVRLLAHDPGRHALLLERCDPGEQLASAAGTAEERLREGAAVLRRLTTDPPPPAGDLELGHRIDALEPLAVVTAEWADLVTERMARLRPPGFDPGLVAEGARLLRELPASADRDVLLHGDLNPGNILSTTDRGWGWLAIDPKPMVGDPAYDPWPLLEQVDDPFAQPDPVRVLGDRVALLAEELSLDGRRIVWWALARMVEWSLWAVEHGDLTGGAEGMRNARVLAELSSRLGA